MRKTILASVAALLLLAGCQAPEPQSKEKASDRTEITECYVYYKDFNDLADQSDVVARVRMSSPRVEKRTVTWQNYDGQTEGAEVRREFPYTIYTAKVLELYKGDLPEEADVFQLGCAGEADGVVSGELVSFDAEKEYILFLKGDKQLSGMTLKTPAQGVYTLPSQSALGDGTLTSYYAYNDMSVTLDDLKKLKEDEGLQ